MPKRNEPSKKPKRDDPAQSRAFIAKAREIGADEEGSKADRLLKRLAKQPPAPRDKPNGS
jgi:hypothetical protein